LIVLWCVIGLLVYFGIGCGFAVLFLWFAIKFGDGEPLSPSFVTAFLWPVVILTLGLCSFYDLFETMFEKIAEMMKQENKR
jgi:hypothetical protein